MAASRWSPYPCPESTSPGKLGRLRRKFPSSSAHVSAPLAGRRTPCFGAALDHAGGPLRWCGGTAGGDNGPFKPQPPALSAGREERPQCGEQAAAYPAGIGTTTRLSTATRAPPHLLAVDRRIAPGPLLVAGHHRRRPRPRGHGSPAASAKLVDSRGRMRLRPASPVGQRTVRGSLGPGPGSARGLHGCFRISRASRRCLGPDHSGWRGSRHAMRDTPRLPPMGAQLPTRPAQESP